MKNTDFTFFVINTKARWEEGYKENLEVSDDGIALKKEPSHVLNRKIGESEEWIEATDIAVDACDVLYILDAEGHRIFTYDHSNERTEGLNSIGGEGTLPGQLKEPQGIALSRDTLYVADTGNNRILAFATINWQIRWVIGATDSEGLPIPNSDEFKPVELVVDNTEHIYVLDSVNHSILKFDKGGRFKGTCVEAELEEPVNITLDKDGFLYVRDTKRVLKFGTESEDNLLELEFDLQEIGIEPSGLAVDFEGNVYVGDVKDLGGREKERFIHKFAPSGNYAGPLLGYRGPCYGMTVDKHGNFYVITGEGGEIAFLRYKTERYYIKEPWGTFISKAFDSTIPDCRWHKIVLDAEIPDKTQVDVYYFISDEEKTQTEMLELSESEWSQLPPFHTATMNLRDALIQSPSGRHLWLKLVLRSTDENKTPRIKSISAYLPRSSYLRYLPAVYQEDTASRDFLERFLSLFETLLWNNEEEITQIARYFDVEATPKEFISWLATWLAAIFDESWSEEKKRLFLQRAVALYKKRGTREGLEELIEIYTGNKPMIIEHFQLGCAENEEIKTVLEKLFGLYLFSIVVGDLENGLDADSIPEELKNMFETKGITLSEIITVTKEDNDKWRVVDEEKESIYIIRKEGRNLNIYFWTPFCFCVLLKPTQAEIYGGQLKTVKRLIEFEKPAHTVAGVMVLQPWIYLDMHTYLGINTYLSKPVMRLGITSVIGRDTVLTDPEEAGQMERRARTGIDTNLT